MDGDARNPPLPLPRDHSVARYWSLISDGLASCVDLNATLLLTDIMHDAGFVNVMTRIFYVPIGVWPNNKVLKMVWLCWRVGAQAIALGPLTRGLNWSREQVEIRLVEVRKAYMDEGAHRHMPLYIIRGQKPES